MAASIEGILDPNNDDIETATDDLKEVVSFMRALELFHLRQLEHLSDPLNLAGD